MDAGKNRIPILLSSTVVWENIVIMKRIGLEILMDTHIFSTHKYKKVVFGMLSV
jgi:hypothetical protein